ncbi:MAG: hypothetical protein LUJ25_10890 [Firmicutes bacterium]|nr:hypothetical protein [Bacillota bacterium]
MLSEYICIEGLNGYAGKYREDFSGYTPADIWKPASFICQLIADLHPGMIATPVIDDRMFVNSCYVNKDLLKEIAVDDPSLEKERLKEFILGKFWYKYVYVDNGQWDMCQHDPMKEQLLNRVTYFRWQKYGTLFGISRYSFVLLKGIGAEYIETHMATLYSRMIELALVQRASMLRFSSEVTSLSNLTGQDRQKLLQKISSLYKEYIRFVNQVYFREVTAQEQGIELYDLLLQQLNSEKQIEYLESEIRELHQYVAIVEEQTRTGRMEWFSWLATIFVPVSLIIGVLGMNSIFDKEYLFLWDYFLYHLLFLGGMIYLTYLIFKRKKMVMVMKKL